MVDLERDGQRRRRRWRMLRPYGTTRRSFGMIRTISDLFKNGFSFELEDADSPLPS